ncbi:MAG: response regulator [Phycisphaeraceae bacterium JB051]
MSTILIVDDDKTIRVLVTQLVNKAGHHCIAARNGKRAIEVLQDNPKVDVVITDMQMPEMHGDALVKYLRADEHFAQIPIIMISGFVQAHEVKDLLANGVDRFVPKPVDTKQLNVYIQDMVEQSKKSAA